MVLFSGLSLRDHVIQAAILRALLTSARRGKIYEKMPVDAESKPTSQRTYWL